MSYTLEQKLAWALEGKARWEAKLTEADRAEESAHEMGGGIPGFGGSGNQRAARQVRSAFESADKKWHEATDKLSYYTDKARSYERRIQEQDRKRFEREDLTGARLIRTNAGWYKVVRINAKSVSVESGYSWVDRIAIDKILEVRT